MQTREELRSAPTQMKDAEDEQFFQEHEHANLLLEEDDIIDEIMHPHAHPHHAHPHYDAEILGVIHADSSVTLGGNSMTFADSAGAYPGGIFAPTSTSVVGASTKTHSSVETVTDRLFHSEKKVKKAKTANDALLSSLPTDSLRWIKKRRKINSFEKVALTYFRERQLRTIFRGLDFDGMGTIHLDLVKDAADYAEEKLRPKKGKPVFVNVRGMFEAMDEDGDGTVDFHEFTIAMTGSSKSAMDNATEQDVEKLTRRFIEFANIRRRERAVEEIKFPMSMVEEQKRRVNQMFDDPAGAAEVERARQRSNSFLKLTETEPDLPRYLHFRTLFSIGAKVSEAETEETVRLEVERMNANVTAAGAGHKRTANEKLLARFHEELTKERAKEQARVAEAAATAQEGTEAELMASSLEAAAKRAKDLEEMEATAARVHEMRIKTEDDARRDPEVRELQEQMAIERKFVREMKKYPWLPPVTPSAAVRKPTMVPPVASPVKKEVMAKLQVNQEYRSVKGRPELVEKEQNEARRSISMAELRQASLSAFRSMASSRLASVSSSELRKDRHKKSHLLRYNFDAD